jgi:signal transduction histidine kinase
MNGVRYASDMRYHFSFAKKSMERGSIPMHMQPPPTQEIAKFEFRVRFDEAGLLTGESLHSSLGERLGIHLDEERALNIYTYLDRLKGLDAELPGRLARRVRTLLEDHHEFSLSGDYHSDGETIHLHISGRVVEAFDGSYNFILLFLDDTQHTHLRRMYEYMFRLANHELKGPLACILGAAEFAEEHAATNNSDGVQTCLDMIQRNVRAMEDMIGRYLTLSRIESGNIKPNNTDLHLRDDVLNSLVQDLQPALLGKGMRVDFSLEGCEHEPSLSADIEMLDTVLRNLVSNALNYGKAKTVIHVRLRPVEEGAEVIVENEGTPIPHEHLDRLFDKFYRVDSTPGSRGVGLGLYNTRKMVELWGGRITVSSEESGTRFTFTIPA